MKRRSPFVLVTTCIDQKGNEFGDSSISLSERYSHALAAHGLIPVIQPPEESQSVIRQLVERCQGVLLTGGDDVSPGLYGVPDSDPLTAKALITPDGGRRDLRELLTISEVFRQGKPLLAICRGHQILNVALGGTLFIDLPTQAPSAINHRQMDRRCEVVHELTLTPGSLVSKILRKHEVGVNSTHHQAVRDIAPALCATGCSPDGLVEVLELRPELSQGLPFLLSVQFHPERLWDRHGEHRRIFQAFARACQRAVST